MEKRFIEQKADAHRPEKQPPEQDQPLLTDIADFLKDTKTVLPLVMLGLFLLAFIGFLHFAKPFVMPILLAVMLSFLLQPVVNFLFRLKIPKWAGGLIIIVLLIATVATVVSHLIEPTKDWMEKAPQNFHKVQQKIEGYIRPARQLGKQVQEITTTSPEQPRAKVEVSQAGLAGTVMSYASSFVATIVEILVLLYFLLATGEMFTQKLVKVLPTLRDKKRAVSIFHEVQNNISVYLLTITVINIVFGTLVGVSVMLLNMPNPLLWGTLAAALNFIPYFGPLTGVTILAVAGLVTFESLGRGFLPPMIYLCLHAIESNLFTPLILGKRLTLNPVVIFGSIIFWMWLWGITGALIAVPLLMIIKIVCDHFKPLAPVAEFLGEAESAAVADR